jgi:antibiotic biosynthesis monooxygenase (ABM) superfamily enzyme
MARLPLPRRALLFPLVVLRLMTLVVMPVVTRVLRRWLGPRPDEEPLQGELPPELDVR